MAYNDCWQLQQSLFESRLAKRRSGEKGEDCGTILTVEHPPVYTLGKSGKASNMLIPQSYLESLGAEFFHLDRGGDITFHGPGQIVCYPILDIEQLGIGLRRYIEILEQAVIETVAHYGIVAEQKGGYPNGYLAVASENKVTEYINSAMGEALTRGQVAQILYQASILAKDAPGLSMYQ